MQKKTQPIRLLCYHQLMIIFFTLRIYSSKYSLCIYLSLFTGPCRKTFFCKNLFRNLHNLAFSDTKHFSNFFNFVFLESVFINALTGVVNNAFSFSIFIFHKECSKIPKSHNKYS